jgi:hypothetical protein
MPDDEEMDTQNEGWILEPGKTRVGWVEGDKSYQGGLLSIEDDGGLEVACDTEDGQEVEPRKVTIRRAALRIAFQIPAAT